MHLTNQRKKIFFQKKIKFEYLPYADVGQKSVEMIARKLQKSQKF